jgi:hypothetical protein
MPPPEAQVRMRRRARTVKAIIATRVIRSALEFI